jgi:hypothetical protein
MHTLTSLRAMRRHLDRRRHNAALHLTFTKSGSNFVLSNGTPVPTDIALLVVNDVRVVPVNDGLFPSTPQTWRWAEALNPKR